MPCDKFFNERLSLAIFNRGNNVGFGIGRGEVLLKWRHPRLSTFGELSVVKKLARLIKKQSTADSYPSCRPPQLLQNCVSYGRFYYEFRK